MPSVCGSVNGLCSAAGGLVHAPPDQQPRQGRHHGQQRKARAPAEMLDQPGQWRACEQQPQSTDTHAHARQKGKAVHGKVARDEHGAGQKGGRAAHADQQLAHHQPAVVGCGGGQCRSRDRQRKRQQHRAPQAVEVHADAHQQLGHAEGQAEQAGEGAQRLGREPEILLQARGHDRGDGAKGLAQRKGREQGQQHGPQQLAARRRCCGGGLRSLCVYVVVWGLLWRCGHGISPGAAAYPFARLRAVATAAVCRRWRPPVPTARCAAPRFRGTAPRPASCADS